MYPFEVIKNYMCDCSHLNKIITRRELIKMCRKEDPICSEATIDTIRRMFTVAGYLETVMVAGAPACGTYRVIKTPDITITKSVLTEEAYHYKERGMERPKVFRNPDDMEYFTEE